MKLPLLARCNLAMLKVDQEVMLLSFVCNFLTFTYVVTEYRDKIAYIESLCKHADIDSAHHV